MAGTPQRVGGTGPVTIAGLRPFMRELRKLKLSREISVANQAAGKVVEARAKANAAALPQGSGKYVARTIKARKLVRAMVIDFGRAGGVPKHPTVYHTAAILEFGTKRDAYLRRRFQPWVGNRYTTDPEVGYMVGRAVRDSADEIVEAYANELEKIAARAFPES